MDEFERRLKQDATAIDAEVVDELRSRIDASLRSTGQVRPPLPERQSQTRLWWRSSLTGLAAAVLVIALVNFNRAPPAEDPTGPGRTVPLDPAFDFPSLSPVLEVRSADFADPLEEEFEKLRADIEKARQSVREEVDFTF